MAHVIDLCSDESPPYSPLNDRNDVLQPVSRTVAPPDDIHSSLPPDGVSEQPALCNDQSQINVVLNPKHPPEPSAHSFSNGQSSMADPTSDDPEVITLLHQLTQIREDIVQYEQLLSHAHQQRNDLKSQLEKRMRTLRKHAEAPFNWLSEFPWDSALRHHQHSVFKIHEFRPLQREALNATLLKRDVFAVLPTGAGKSLIYQLAAVVDAGLTLVITPLISLSQDQRSSLAKLGIQAETLDSTTPKETVARIYQDILPAGGRVGSSAHPRKRRRQKRNARPVHKGNCKPTDRWVRDDMNPVILFVTPEQVARSKRLMSRLEDMHEAGHFSRICIDEAHCCSEWGHDFRPDYRKLGLLRRQCPNTPILALSATCSPDTLGDVATSLEMRDWVTFRGALDRPNLYYDVQQKKDNEDDVVQDILIWLENDFRDMCGIIYVLSKKEAKSYAEKLAEGGVNAGSYHGDMDSEARIATHRDWSEGNIRVVVATIAFGLGIDNRNARFVIHATMATSVEGYYQESGRCGRDGRRGYCRVLQRAKDFSRLSAFVAERGQDRVNKFYDMYRYATGRPMKGNCVGDGKITQACRRSSITAAFGEIAPTRTQLEGANGLVGCCDLCRERVQGCSSSNVGTSTVRVDVTNLARNAVLILQRVAQRKPDEKVTLLALASYWSGRGAKACDMRGEEIPAVSGKICIETRLEILVQLVLDEVLEEYFRHSSFAMSAYVACGCQANSIIARTKKVILVADRRAARECQQFGHSIVIDDQQVSGMVANGDQRDGFNLKTEADAELELEKVVLKGEEEESVVDHGDETMLDEDNAENGAGDAVVKVEEVTGERNRGTRRKRKIIESDEEMGSEYEEIILDEGQGDG